MIVSTFYPYAPNQFLTPNILQPISFNLKGFLLLQTLGHVTIVFNILGEQLHLYSSYCLLCTME